MKAFELVVECGDDVFKTIKVGDDAKAVKKSTERQYGCDVLRIKDVTENYPINTGTVAAALSASSLGEKEMKIILDFLNMYENLI